MHDLPDESDRYDDFDGYLAPEDGPVAYRSTAEFEEQDKTPSRLRRSQSLHDLTELEQALTPLPGLSPSLSPMQGQHASGSPLAGGIPTPLHTSASSTASSSSSTLSAQVIIHVLTQTTWQSFLYSLLCSPPSHTHKKELLNQAAAPPPLFR